MLQGLLEGMAGEFARLIVPWYDEVSVVFRDCDGPAEASCAAGVAAVEAGNYDLAVQHFDAAAAAGRALAADEQAEIHWNRGLALEYGGQFADAIAAFGEARRLVPGEADYAREMENVQRMKTNADQLLEQGVGQAPAPEGAEPGVSP